MYLSLYLSFIKLRIMEVAEYRKAFFAGAFAQIAAYGAEFILVWVLLEHFKSINGWGTYEVVLLYALNLGSYAIAGFFFFSPSNQLVSMIKTGSFDEVLTKPINSFFYLICREFNSGYLSHLLLSLLVIILSFSKLGISWNFTNVFILVLVLIGGSLIQGAGFIFTSVPSFWFVESGGLKDIFFFQLKGFIRYPITIFNNYVQVFLTFIVPYAFINFYPVQFFLKEKYESVIFHPIFELSTPIVGLICIYLAYRFWMFGINNYKSTGS